MKVKLKDGRIFPIEEGSLIALDNNGETLEVKVEEIDSIVTDNINWEKRRYEISEECVAVLMRNEITLEDAAKVSVEQADALINELKK